MLPEEHIMRTYGWCLYAKNVCFSYACLPYHTLMLLPILQSPSWLIRIVRNPIYEKRHHHHHDFFNIFISFMP